MEKIIEMVDPVATPERADDDRKKDEKINNTRKNGRQRIPEAPLDECQSSHQKDGECAHEHFRAVALCVCTYNRCPQSVMLGLTTKRPVPRQSHAYFAWIPS